MTATTGLREGTDRTGLAPVLLTCWGGPEAALLLAWGLFRYSCGGGGAGLAGLVWPVWGWPGGDFVIAADYASGSCRDRPDGSVLTYRRRAADVPGPRHRRAGFSAPTFRVLGTDVPVSWFSIRYAHRS